MEYIIVGLGNPGEEYGRTRHNIGRIAVLELHTKLGGSDWRADKTLRAQIARAVLPSGEILRLVLPDNYMNRSGGSVAPLVRTKKALERLLIVHDDIDLPFGTLRFVYDRGAGGHNGVLSIERALKSRSYARLRIGVVPTTPGGKMKKPRGSDVVHDFVLDEFGKKERAELAHILDKTTDALCMFVQKGLSAAQRTWNS